MYIVLIYICKSYYADIPEYVMKQGRYVNTTIHVAIQIAVPRK
jgi:hypothetical protein